MIISTRTMIISTLTMISTPLSPNPNPNYVQDVHSGEKKGENTSMPLPHHLSPEGQCHTGMHTFLTGIAVHCTQCIWQSICTASDTASTTVSDTSQLRLHPSHAADRTTSKDPLMHSTWYLTHPTHPTHPTPPGKKRKQDADNAKGVTKVASPLPLILTIH